MRHRKYSVKFGRQRSHYKATLRHLVTGLVINKSISTTKVRAKQASRLAEKLVTIARDKTVANQRKVYSVLRSRDLVSILFNEIAPLFKDRNGGYTRIMLTKRRRGDNAQMAILEFVEKPKTPEKEEKKKTKAPRLESKPKAEKKRKLENAEPIRDVVEEIPSKENKSKILKEKKIEPHKEEVVKKKEEVKKVERPPQEPEKPKETKPRPGFFKKFFGKKKDM
ncbi:50S ribosomal protein L17 [Candidatus Omnitrophota bacterium]